MEASSSRGRKTATNTRGRSPCISGGNRRGRGIRPSNRITTRSQTLSRRQVEPYESVMDSRHSTDIVMDDYHSTVASSAGSEDDVGEELVFDTTIDISMESRLPRSQSIQALHQIRIQFPDDDASDEEDDSFPQQCGLRVSAEESSPIDEPLCSLDSGLRPSTRETPPNNNCPYGADLISIFETSDMYVKRRDQYRPVFEQEVFLQQSLLDIGVEGVKSAIAQEIQLRTGASNIAVTIKSEDKAAIAALQTPGPIESVDESYQLVNLFCYDLVESEYNLVSGSGLLPTLKIEDQQYQYSIQQQHSSFCETETGRQITRVMLTEDPATAAKIMSMCDCQHQELLTSTSLEVQHCTFTEDSTLIGSSYGRVYNFLPASPSIEEAVRQAAGDDGGWEYAFQEKRAALCFISSLKTMNLEDLVYLFITAGLYSKLAPIGSRPIRRVYLNPR